MNNNDKSKEAVWSMTWTKATLIEYLKDWPDNSEIIFKCKKCRTYHQSPPIIKEKEKAGAS